MRVLFVDDDSSVLKQAEIFLEEEDERLDIDTAMSAGEGLEKLSGRDYDAIVSDYQMPEMDGLEFLKTVREERNSDIPFIIFTGKGREDVAMEALNLGADHYLQKKGDPKSQYGVLAQEIVQEIEHSKAGKRLKKKERFLSGISEGDPIPTFVLDEDHKITFWNKALENISGINEEEVIGTDEQWRAFYKEQRPVLADLIIEGIDEDSLKEYYGDKYSSSTLKGSYEAVDFFPKLGEEGRWIHFTASPIKDDKNDIIGAIETLQDITERKKAEEEMRKTKEKFKELFEAAPDPAYLIGEDGKFREVNEAFVNKLGFDREEIIGKSIENPVPFLSEESRQKAMENFRKRLKGEDISSYPLEIRMEDGEILYAEINANPIIQGGEVVGEIGIARDLSGRKEVEEELEEKHRQLKTLFRNLPGMAYRCLNNRSWTMTFLSEGCKDLTGYEPYELIDDEKIAYGEVIVSDDRDYVWNEVQSGLEKKEPFEVVYRIETSEGDEKWVWEQGRGVFDDGDVKFLEGFIQDITERKRTEEREKFLNTLLRQDLRSKCQSIHGYLNLLQDVDIPDEHEEYLKDALEEFGEADEILSLARELEKIEKSDWVAEKDVFEVMNHVLEDISDLVGSGGVEVERNYSDDVGLVLGDYSLNTLFSELLRTRIRTSGCDRIKISGRKGGEEVLVSVEDDGESLPGEVEDLFSGRIYKGETTGVGGVRYYMIRQIAEHHDAKIEVGDSELGGPKFSIHLRKA